MTDLYIDPKVEALRALHRETLAIDRQRISIRELLSRQAQSILDGHRDGNDAVVFHLSSWCPELVGKPAPAIMNATVSLELARQTIAREYGYANWAAVEALGDTRFDEGFEQAVDWVITGRIAPLSETLAKRPGLARQASQHPHRATLLHYVAANGVESHRQITPLNAADVARCLIRAGSDVNATADIYGGGSTTLSLALSSAHPANAGVLDELARVLVEAGAR